MGMKQDQLRKWVLFDVERFNDLFGLYIQIPGFPPLLLWNPSIDYVRTFMQKANIHPACLVSGMFWDLYKYKYSLEWLDLVINKKEITKDERTNERSFSNE